MNIGTVLTRTFMLGVITTLGTGCAVVSGRETAGEYMDDASITTKVKAAIFDEPTLKSNQISVTTFQDVVQLSGFVDTLQNRMKAGELASSVKGVQTVKNDLIVR